MNASLITRRVRKVVVAGSVLAATLALAPANAATVPPPIVQTTSLSSDNMWSKISTVVSVDYNRNIDVAGSTVTVTDGAGFPVIGVVDTPFVIVPVNNVPTRFNTAPDILYFDPQLDFTEEDGPYTATFSARSLGQDPLAASTVTTYTFRIDRGVPAAPSLATFGGTQLPRNAYPGCGVQMPPPNQSIGCPLFPSNPVPKEVAVVSSGEAVQLSGYAKDKVDNQGNPDFASGIEKVTLHFFSLTSGDTSGREITAMRTTITNPCGAGLCPVDQTFQAQLDLPDGYWTVRASTADLAGNLSGQSDPVAVLVLG